MTYIIIWRNMTYITYDIHHNIFLPCDFFLSSSSSLWSPYVIGQTIIFFSFFSRLISAVGDRMSTILPHMVWPWCEFRMHVWNVLHAARWKYRMQKVAILAPSHNFVGLYLHSLGMYRQSEKNLLNTDTSPTCPHNMVNFVLLIAEICWRVWGTPANLNVFRVLTALLHGTLLVGVSQTAALNRGRHLHSAWRSLRWALAHILVMFVLEPLAGYCCDAGKSVFGCACVWLLGIPSTLLSYKFGYRTSVMFGGVLACTGFALSFFCRELHELYLCIGVVAGNSSVLLSSYSSRENSHMLPTLS